MFLSVGVFRQSFANPAKTETAVFKEIFMTATTFLQYGKPVKFLEGSNPILLKFPDFNLQFLKKAKEFLTVEKSGPYAIYFIFELTDSSGKKSELSAVASAGLREEGPKFISNRISFQLMVTEYNGFFLKDDHVVVVLD